MVTFFYMRVQERDLKLKGTASAKALRSEVPGACVGHGGRLECCG